MVGDDVVVEVDVEVVGVGGVNDDVVVGVVDVVDVNVVDGDVVVEVVVVENEVVEVDVVEVNVLSKIVTALS